MAAAFVPDAVEAFQYVGWDYEDGELRLRYALDRTRFEERFVFPEADRLDLGTGFEQALSVLHLCAGTSYYKAAAPGFVSGLPMGAEVFASDLFQHGLAEFAMANDLDPIRPTFMSGPARLPGTVPLAGEGPALIAVGGGKDSIVTIESAKRVGRAVMVASVGTHPAIERTAAVSGLGHLVIQRRIDPLLLELNGQGALNGHVPVTAINSAALAALAAGLGAEAVVMSNESSASVPIATHRGLPVNHQWSKSLAAERSLAALLPVPYFSLLRPLHEVEICRRFAPLDPYFELVTSCNQAYTAAGRAAGIRWCGDCPKCRFVFLAMAPFLDPDALVAMFDGRDLLADDRAANIAGYRAILGLGGDPPMECVGTTRESKWALTRLAEHPDWRRRTVVRALSAEVDVVAGWDPLAERGPHAIPPGWQEVADALA